jgi:hypothetical protein
MPCVSAASTQCRTAAISTEPLVNHNKNLDCQKKCRKKYLGNNSGSRSYQGRPSALLSPVAPTTQPRHRDVKLRRQLITEIAFCQTRILAVLNTSKRQILGAFFLLKAAFAIAILDLISRVHLA